MALGGGTASRRCELDVYLVRVETRRLALLFRDGS